MRASEASQDTESGGSGVRGTILHRLLGGCFCVDGALKTSVSILQLMEGSREIQGVFTSALAAWQGSSFFAAS